MENKSKSFSQIAFEQLKKNKLAAFGAVIIWVLITVAVFAPLLANEKPLAIKKIFKNKYENAFYVIIDTLETLRDNANEINADVKKLNDSFRIIQSNSNVIKEMLNTDDKNNFIKLMNDVETSLKNNQIENLNNIIVELENKFSMDSIKLTPKIYFPAIKNLKHIEITVILSYLIFFGTMIFVKNRFGNWFKVLCLSFLISFICGITWHLINPPFFDITNYKKIAHQEDTKWVIFTIIPYGENENITSELKQKPGWLLDDFGNKNFREIHFLGTDTTGRDVLTRMIYGARIAVSIGILSVCIYVTIGIIIGAIIGYFGGLADILVSRIIEIIICFPIFFLILTIIAYLKPSIYNIIAVLGLVWWTGIARLERGEFLRLVNEDFVLAVKALGGSHLRIIFKHILPNALGPILVSASFGIAGAILVESSLSFLGFGVPQPTASWGDILKDGQNDIQGTWWLTIFPGFAIFITVTAFNLLGDGIRDAIDPKLID